MSYRSGSHLRKWWYEKTKTLLLAIFSFSIFTFTLCFFTPTHTLLILILLYFLFGHWRCDEKNNCGQRKGTCHASRFTSQTKLNLIVKWADKDLCDSTPEARLRNLIFAVILFILCAIYISNCYGAKNSVPFKLGVFYENNMCDDAAARFSLFSLSSPYPSYFIFIFIHSFE